MRFRSLRHAVSARLSGSTATTNAPVLLPLLRPHLAAFRLLLSHTRAKGGEGSAARAQLQAGSATLGDGRALPLSRIAVQTALELSDELNVDEMVAVELIVVTNQERGARNAEELKKIAGGIYAEERRSLVEVLSFLLRIQVLGIEDTGDAVGQEMLAEEVATFLRELLSQTDSEGLSLVRRIIKLIHETAPGGTAGSVTMRAVIDAKEKERPWADTLVELRTLLFQSLYLLCHLHTALPSEDMRGLGQELTQLVKETALTWCSLAEEEHSAREQAFVAVLSLAQALSVVGPNNADSTAGVPEGRVALSHDPTLRSTLSKLVGSGGDDGYLAVAQLAFGLLQAEDAAEDAAATSQPVLVAACKAGALQCMISILRSLAFQDSALEDRILYAQTIHRMVGVLVDRHLGAGAQVAYGQHGAWEPRTATVEKLRDLVMDSEGLSVASSLVPAISSAMSGVVMPDPSKAPPPSEAYPALLDTLAALYEMHPPLAGECANLWTFLDFACLSRNPPATDAGYRAVAQATYMPLLRLIGALATDEQSAAQHWRMMQDGLAFVSWAQLFTFLLDYCRLYAEPEEQLGGAPPPEMSEESVAGMEAYLRLLARLVTVGDRDHTRQRVYNLRDAYGAEYAASSLSLMFPLEPLLRLYCCRVSPSLRACILDTVGAFAMTANEAAAIWARLEQTHVLADSPAMGAMVARGAPAATMTPQRWLAGPPTTAAGLVPGSTPAPHADIRHQLNQVEAMDECYPETLAFLRLLNKLVRVCSNPGSGQPPVGPAADEGRALLRYYQFVCGDVFSTLSVRTYKAPKQRWELYHECLLFFSATLQLVGPELGSPSAATGAMTGRAAANASSRQAMPIAASPLPAYALFSTPGSAASRRLVPAGAAGDELGELSSPFGAANAGAAPGEAAAGPAPGWEILRDCMGSGTQAMSSSVLLRGVLSILSRGQTAVQEERVRADSGLVMEAAALAAMRLLESVLSLDLAYLEVARGRALGLALPPLHSVLLADPKLPAVLEFVRYPVSYDDGALARAALGLLTTLAARVDNLVPMLVQAGGEPFCAQLRDGLGTALDEALEFEEAGGGEANGETLAPLSTLIMQLVLSCVAQPAPNLAHLLLGFEVVRTEVHQSHLQPHRTFTCLRVILDRLRLGATGVGSPAEEEFREQALWILHELAAETATALPTLSMMRDGAHLQVLLLQLQRSAVTALPAEGAARVAALGACGWALQLATLVLFTADLDVPSDRQAAVQLLETLLSPLGEERAGAMHEGMEHPRMLVLEILDCAAFALHEPELCMPSADAGSEVQRLFIQRTVELIRDERTVEEGGCREWSPRGNALVSLPALFAALRAERKALEGAHRHVGAAAAAGLKHAAREAVELANRRNCFVEEASTQERLVDAWVELLEVALWKHGHLMGSPGSTLPTLPEATTAVLHAALDTLNSPTAEPRLAAPLCRLVRTLMAKLQSLAPTVAGKGAVDGMVVSVAELLSLLAKLVGDSHVGAALGGVGAGAILQQSSNPPARLSLYAALLSYLQHCATPRAATMPVPLLRALLAAEQQVAGNGMVRPDSGVAGAAVEALAAAEQVQMTLEKGTVAGIVRAAAALLQLLRTDVARGDLVGARTLAYTVVGALVAAEPALEVEVHRTGLPRQWLEEVAAAPYQALLLPSAASLRTLHVTEAQLTVLLRLATAHRPAGAQRLAAAGALAALTQCRLIDVEPEEAPAWAAARAPGPTAAFIPAPSQRTRHHQILAPLLRVVLVIAAALPESTEVAMQVQEFVLAHQRTLLRILADRAVVVCMEDLVELELVVNLVTHLNFAHRAAAATLLELRAALDKLVWKFASGNAVADNKYLAFLASAAAAPPHGGVSDSNARTPPARVAVLVRAVRLSLARYLRRTYGGPSAPPLPASHAALHSQVTAMDMDGAPSEALSLAGRPTLMLVTDFLAHTADALRRAFDSRYAVLKLLADPSAGLPAVTVNRLRAMVAPAAIATDGPVDAAHPPSSVVSGSRLSERELASAGMSIVTEIRQLLYTMESVLVVIHTHLPAAGAGEGRELGSATELERLATHQLEVLDALKHTLDLKDRDQAKDLEAVEDTVRRIQSAWCMYHQRQSPMLT